MTCKIKKNKILIITEYFFPEEFKINELALAWKDKGYAVSVLTLQPSYPEGFVYEGYKNSLYKIDQYQDIKIYRLKAIQGYKESVFKKIMKYFYFMTVATFWVLRHGNKFDFAFGFNIASLTAMFPGIVLKKIYKKPFTLWVQDIWPDSIYAYGFKKTKLKEKLLNAFVRYIYGNASRIAISCEGFAAKIRPYIGGNTPVVYLPNWSEELKAADSDFRFSEKDKIHFVFAGNLGKVQNLDNIIEAYRILPESYKKRSQLNFIGDGSFLEQLEQLAGDEINESIFFWGRQSRDSMYKFYAASDFLIISLKDDPIFSITVPSKFQTYLAAKKPILAFIKGEVSDIVKENNLGLVALPNDINGINKVFIKSIELSVSERAEFLKSSQLLLDTAFKKELIIDKLINLACK